MGCQERISPYNVNTISRRQVMRTQKNINLEIISWSNTKFSDKSPLWGCSGIIYRIHKYIIYWIIFHVYVYWGWCCLCSFWETLKGFLETFSRRNLNEYKRAVWWNFLSMNLFQGGASPESVLLHDDWRSCMLDLLIFSNRSLSFFFVFFKSSNITDMKKSMFFHCWVFFI